MSNTLDSVITRITRERNELFKEKLSEAEMLEQMSKTPGLYLFMRAICAEIDEMRAASNPQ